MNLQGRLKKGVMSSSKLNRTTALTVVVMYALSILSFFRNEDGSFELSSVTNFLFLAFSLFLFLLVAGKNINARLLAIYLAASVFLIIHSLYLADYAVHKHLLNQLGFLFAATASALFLQRSARRCRMDLALNHIVRVSFLLFLPLFFSAAAGIGQIVNSLNHWYAFIHETIWVEKQQLGVFLAWMLIASLVVGNKRKVNHVILLSMLFLLGVGIRSFVAGFVLLAIFLFVGKYKVIRLLYIVAPFSLAILVFWKQLTVPLMLLFDIRGLMLQATLDIAHQYPIGIGIGGYAAYLPEHYQFTSGDYREVSDVYRYLSRDFALNVLESDLMVMVFTFGVFVSATYYAASLTLLDYLLRKNKFILDGFEKAVALLFGWYLFAGITQDYIFKLHWWVMVSFVLFVLMRVRLKKRQLSRVHCGA